MKREELPNSSPWQSQAEAAALLDSLDDVMWDELEAIRGTSPIQSPAAAQVHTLQSGSGASPIRGEDQEDAARQLSSGGAGVPFATNDAFWAGSCAPAAAFGSVSMAMTSTRTPSSTWANVESELVMQCNDLPNASAMERRRQKNRDCMRRARQRQREQLNDMKKTMATLEKQYADLSLTPSQHRTAQQAPGQGTLVTNRMASDFDEAAELTRRLGAENLFLKAEIQQQAAWKSNLSRVLQSTMEVDGPRWAQQFQQPSLGGDAVLRMRLDERDQFEAAEEFGFHPLTDFGLTQVILENSRTISRVQSRLLVPSSFDSDDGARTRRMQSFGWDMVQCVHGNIMECVFTKKFRGLNVAQLMQKTWANDMRLGEFKKVKGETSRLEVLQQVNPNAYVLVRDVMSPTEDIATFRSVFVRFLIETSKRIPVSKATFAPTCIDASAPSTPPQYADSDSDSDELLLEATGFVLGTQSFDTDYSRNPREEDVRKKVAWAHLSLSIEFLNVVNPVTGDEYQQLRWSGRTDYCGPEHAQRNASDMLQGMLRWELLVIAPALNLFSLSIE